MASGFDRWEKDPFFPAAEEVQDSADRCFLPTNQFFFQFLFDFWCSFVCFFCCVLVFVRCMLLIFDDFVVLMVILAKFSVFVLKCRCMSDS